MAIQFENLLFLVEVYRKFIVKYFYWVIIFYSIFNIQLFHSFSFIFYLENNFNSIINLFFQIINIINFNFLDIFIQRLIFLLFILLWLILNFLLFFILLLNKNIKKNKKKIIVIIFLVSLFFSQYVLNIPSNNLFIKIVISFNEININTISELIIIILILVFLLLQKIVFIYLLIENFYINKKNLYLKLNLNFEIFLNIFAYTMPILQNIYSKYDKLYTLIILIILIFYNFLIIIFFNKYDIYLNKIEKKIVFFNTNYFFILLFFNIFIIIFSIKNLESVIYLIIILIFTNLYTSSNLKSNLFLNNSKNLWKKVIYFYINNVSDSSTNFKIFRLHNKNCQNISCECKKIINKDLININKVSILKILVNIHLKNLKMNVNKKRMLEINLIKNIEPFLYQYISLTIKIKNSTKNSNKSIQIELIKRILNKYIKRININDNLNNVSFEELTSFYRNYENFKKIILEFSIFFNKYILNYNLEVENVELLKKNILNLSKMNLEISKIYSKLINTKNSKVVKIIYLNFVLIFLNDKIKGNKIYHELIKENNKSNLNSNVLNCFTINFFVIASIETNFSLTFLEFSESFADELKYNKEEIKTVTLTNILLYSINNIHDSYIKNFLKDKKFSKNNKKKVFVLTKEGYIKCYKMEFKIIPEIVNKLKIIGIFKKMKKYKYFIVLDLYQEKTFLHNKKWYDDFKLINKNENYYLKNDQNLLATDYFKDLKNLKNLNEVGTYYTESIYKEKINETYELTCKNLKTIINKNDFYVIFIGFNYKIIKNKNILMNKIKKVNKLLSNVIKINKEKISISDNNDFGFNTREKIFKKINNIINKIIIFLMLFFFLIFIIFIIIFYYNIEYTNNKKINQTLLSSFNGNFFVYYKYIYESTLLYEYLNNNENYQQILIEFNNLNEEFKINQKNYVNSINFSNNIEKNKINNLNKKKIEVYVSKNKNLSKIKYYSINNYYNILSKSEIIRNAPIIRNNFDNLLYIKFNFLSSYGNILDEIEVIILKSVLDYQSEYIFIITTFGLIFLFLCIILIIFFLYYYLTSKYVNNKISYYFSILKNTIKNNNLDNKNFIDNEIRFDFLIENIEVIKKRISKNNLNNNSIKNKIENNNSGDNKIDTLELNKKKLTNIIKEQKYKSNNKNYKNHFAKIIFFILFWIWINFIIFYIKFYFHEKLSQSFSHLNNIFKVKIIINKFMILYVNSFSKFEEIKSINYFDKFKIEYNLISKNINEIFTLNNNNSILFGNYVKIENDFFNINSCNGFNNKENNCNLNELYNKGAFSIIIFIYENLRKELGNYNKNLIVDTSKIIDYWDERLNQIKKEFSLILIYFINFEFYLIIGLVIIFFIYFIVLIYYLVRILFNLRKNIRTFENFLLNFI